MVTRQAAAAPVVLYPEEVRWSVANELLHIAFTDSLYPHIPRGFPGRPKGTGGDITCQVRALENIKILMSYLLLVWSGRGPIGDQSGSLAEMQTAIREDFSGIGLGRQRKDI